jgi:hypothetical protein
MNTITSADAIFTLSISDLFDSPVQLQGFSTDDIFTTQPVQSAEVMMGVDGFLSGGFVYNPFVQTIALQADSLSNLVFDQWHQGQQAVSEVYVANGVIILKAIRRKFTMSRGFLTSYPPAPDAAKTLRPRRYGITWNNMVPENI